VALRDLLKMERLAKVVEGRIADVDPQRDKPVEI
jgi:hypothetical protein